MRKLYFIKTELETTTTMKPKKHLSQKNRKNKGGSLMKTILGCYIPAQTHIKFKAQMVYCTILVIGLATMCFPI